MIENNNELHKIKSLNQEIFELRSENIELKKMIIKYQKYIHEDMGAAKNRRK